MSDFHHFVIHMKKQLLFLKMIIYQMVLFQFYDFSGTIAPIILTV